MSAPQPRNMEWLTEKLTGTCEGVTTREQRTWFEKGLMYYQSWVDHLSAKLTRVGRDLDTLLYTTICEETGIKILSKRLFEVYQTYENLNSDFWTFSLDTTQTTMRANRPVLHSWKLGWPVWKPSPTWVIYKSRFRISEIDCYGQ